MREVNGQTRAEKSALDEREQVLMIERDIMVPVKWALAAISLVFIWLINRDLLLATRRGGIADWTFYLVVMSYAATNVAFSYLFWKRKADPLRWVQWHAWFSLTADALFVGGLVYFTGGVESELYLIYCMLFMRNAANFPSILVQAPTHILFMAYYMLGVYLADPHTSFRVLAGRAFVIRIVLLLGVALCSGALSRLLKSRHEALTRALGELRRARDQLVRSERLATVGQMAAGVAHELKNPLGSMANAVYYLVRHLGENAGPEMRKQLHIVEEEVRRSDRIIMDLLNYSRPAERRLVQTDLNDLAREVLAEAREEIERRRIRVKTTLDGSLPRMRMDARQIKLALRNLIDNACQAMERGGKLTITSWHGGVSSDDGTKENIFVAVADNGVGVPSGELDRIFEPFYSGRKEGTGLGLFAASNAVQAHSGHIEVESEPGKGSKFTIVLPVEDEKEHPGRVAEQRL